MMKSLSRFLCCTIFFGIIQQTALAQPKTDAYLYDILRQSQDPVLQQVIASPDSFRVQIIYTQIDRNRKNQPGLTNYSFNLDSNLYFNPASTVKLPLALLALEKLNDMKAAGVDKYSPLLIDSSQPWQHAYHADSSASNGYPSIAQFIRRAMLISENDPYNRLYQFVGQQQTNWRLHELGF
ncbi:MAG: serine hydrolase, partial [Chitinophagaceae bacterium]